MYEFVDENASMRIGERSLYYALSNGVMLTEEEAQAILNCEKDYPDLKTFKLEQNYRSTQTIVGAANHIIKNNKDQFKKNVFTENVEGEKISHTREYR